MGGLARIGKRNRGNIFVSEAQERIVVEIDAGKIGVSFLHLIA